MVEGFFKAVMVGFFILVISIAIAVILQTEVVLYLGIFIMAIVQINIMKDHDS